MPYAFRSFDRQWIIPDSRPINQPNPSLWNGHSKKQVYLTALDYPAAASGPAVTLTSLIPDLHHFKGSFGGRVYRLYADSAVTLCEVSPAIIKLLSDTYGRAIVGDEVMAYVADAHDMPDFVLGDEKMFVGVYGEVKRANVLLEDLALSTEQNDQIGRYLARRTCGVLVYWRARRAILGLWFRAAGQASASKSPNAKEMRKGTSSAASSW
jgi:hypothetical protein